MAGRRAVESIHAATVKCTGITVKTNRNPLFEERLRYLMHCEQVGVRPKALRAVAAHQVNLVHLLDLRKGGRVDMARIEAAAEQWSLPGGRRCRQPALAEARQRFVGHAVRWLRFVNLLEEPCKARHAHTGEVAVFAAWMRTDRGWSEETIRGCCGTVDCFFDWLDDRGVALASVAMTDIDQAVARWHARDYTRRPLKSQSSVSRRTSPGTT